MKISDTPGIYWAKSWRENLMKISNSPGKYWTKSWNPIVGCRKVSRGCSNCWAESMTFRLAKNQKTSKSFENALDSNGNWNGTIHKINSTWTPTNYKQPQIIATCWLSDLFNDQIFKGHPEWIDHVFKIMADYTRHQFLVLTKRPHNMAAYLSDKRWKPLPNVWLGTSIERQAFAKDRLYWLHMCPGINKWVSAEPLLSQLHLDLEYKESRIAGVVAGAEQHTGSPPPKIDWFLQLRDQCEANKTMFFVKTLGNQWNNRRLEDVEHNELPWNYGQIIPTASDEAARTYTKRS